MDAESQESSLRGAAADVPSGGAATLSHPSGTADLDHPNAVDLALDRLEGASFHRLLALLRDQGPIADTTFFGLPSALVTTFDAAREVLRDDDGIPGAPTYELSTRPTVGTTFIDQHGEQHQRTRKLATPAFRSRAVERFDAGRLRALADELLTGLVGDGETDLVASFTTVLPYLAISRKLGLPPADEDATRRMALGLISGAMDEQVATSAREEFDALLGESIAARRTEPREDVLTGLVHAERDGERFTDEDVRNHVRLLFAVGASTTAHGLGNLFSALLHRPEVMEAVRADPGLRAGAVREALRFDPPVSILPRLLRSPTTVLGRELPAPSFLLVGIASANRDPSTFPDPDVFDPARRAPDVLTFGSGVKFCPGSHLATWELEVGLDAALAHLPHLRLMDEAGSLPVGGPLRAPEALHVAWG